MDNINNTEVEKIKLTILKEQADELKIKYHPNIGVDKLQEKITSHIKQYYQTLSEPTKIKTKTQTRADLRKEALKLQRVAITCMNPDKRQWKGEIFTAANAVVGTIKKYIPFNGKPYHVPTMLLKQLKNRKFQQFHEVQLGNGKFRIQSSLVPEFAISYLPPLTTEEFEKLQKEQAYSQSTPQGGLN